MGGRRASGTYGAGMDLVGAVAISPYANMSPLVDAAERGELSGAGQFRDYIWILQSVANMDPDFDLDAYRSGVARDQWDVLADCAPPDPEAVKRTLDQLDPNDLRPRDPGAAADFAATIGRAGCPRAIRCQDRLRCW